MKPRIRRAGLEWVCGCERAIGTGDTPALAYIDYAIRLAQLKGFL